MNLVTDYLMCKMLGNVIYLYINTDLSHWILNLLSFLPFTSESRISGKGSDV